MGNLKTRIEQLEQGNYGPSIILYTEDEPELEAKAARDKGQGRTVIVLSAEDARL